MIVWLGYESAQAAGKSASGLAKESTPVVDVLLPFSSLVRHACSGIRLLLCQINTPSFKRLHKTPPLEPSPGENGQGRNRSAGVAQRSRRTLSRRPLVKMITAVQAWGVMLHRPDITALATCYNNTSRPEACASIPSRPIPSPQTVKKWPFSTTVCLPPASSAPTGY